MASTTDAALFRHANTFERYPSISIEGIERKKVLISIFLQNIGDYAK